MGIERSVVGDKVNQRTVEICAANGVLNSRCGKASMYKWKPVQKHLPHTYQHRGNFDSSSSRRRTQLNPPHKTNRDVL